MIDETLSLLNLWHEGVTIPVLTQAARESGRFPSISASRLENLVSDGFAPRYLVHNGTPAYLLKRLTPLLNRRELEQLMFLFTCRAHPILADFVREVYWPAYAAGRNSINNDVTRTFVSHANQNGKTTKPWSDSTIIRAARYLTGCCADFGLLERGKLSERQILSFRLEPRVTTLLAHELHFAGVGDSRLVHDTDWALFGLEPADVLSELKRMALKGILILQSAGGSTAISWQYKSMNEVLDALAHGAF